MWRKEDWLGVGYLLELEAAGGQEEERRKEARKSQRQEGEALPALAAQVLVALGALPASVEASVQVACA